MSSATALEHRVGDLYCEEPAQNVSVKVPVALWRAFKYATRGLPASYRHYTLAQLLFDALTTEVHIDHDGYDFHYRGLQRYQISDRNVDPEMLERRKAFRAWLERRQVNRELREIEKVMSEKE